MVQGQTGLECATHHALPPANSSVPLLPWPWSNLKSKPSGGQPRKTPSKYFRRPIGGFPTPGPPSHRLPGAADFPVCCIASRSAGPTCVPLPRLRHRNHLRPAADPVYFPDRVIGSLESTFACPPPNLNGGEARGEVLLIKTSKVLPHSADTPIASKRVSAFCIHHSTFTLPAAPAAR